MGKYITNFATTAEFEAAEDSLIKPHVSLTRDNMDVHYLPFVDTRVVAKFNVTSTSNPTPIGCNAYISGFSAIEIDGVEQPSVVSAYTFSTTGEHIVKYTLTDPTTISSSAFDNCYGLTSIDIPDNVTSINNQAFHNCYSLTSCTIGSGVTSIGELAFYWCNNLTNITCNATTAPTIDSSTFQSVKTNGTLYVPQGSSGYNVWMGTGNYYLGKYGWTKVEQ